MADSTGTTLSIDLRARTATFQGDMRQATELVTRSFATMKDSAEKASAGTDQVSHGAGGIRAELGLLDNTIRGNHAAAMADLIRKFSDSAIVMKSLPLAAAGAGIVFGISLISEGVAKLNKWNEAVRQSQDAGRGFSNDVTKSMLEMEEHTLGFKEKIASLTGKGGPVTALDTQLTHVKDTLGSIALNEALESQLDKLSKSIPPGEPWYSGIGERAKGAYHAVVGDPKKDDQVETIASMQEQLRAMESDGLGAKKAMLDLEIQRAELVKEDMKASDPKAYNQQIVIDGLKAVSRELAKKIEEEKKQHLADILAKEGEAARKANEEFKKFVETLDKLQDGGRRSMKRLRPFMFTSTNTDAADPTGQFRSELGAASITSMIPSQSQMPIYSGSPRAMDLEKIKTDNAVAAAAADRLKESVMTQTEAWRQQYEVLVELYDQGRLTDTEFDRGIKQVEQGVQGATKNWRQLEQKVGDTILQAAIFGRSWKQTLKELVLELSEAILKQELLNKLQKQGADGSDSSGGGGGGIGGFFRSLFGGSGGGGGGGGGSIGDGDDPIGHAAGGSIGSGQWGLVGEKGPELVFGGARGLDVLPNHVSAALSSIQAGGGRGGDIHYHIDARGTDAAVVEQRVRRAVAEAHDSAIVNAVKAQRERQRRTPVTHNRRG